METVKNSNKNTSSKRNIKSRKVPKASVLSVRISADDKDRINRIMKASKINNYSDFMRIALQMIQQQLLSG
jgi:hypothetical protein